MHGLLDRQRRVRRGAVRHQPRLHQEVLRPRWHRLRRLHQVRHSPALSPPFLRSSVPSFVPPPLPSFFRSFVPSFLPCLPSCTCSLTYSRTHSLGATSSTAALSSSAVQAPTDARVASSPTSADQASRSAPWATGRRPRRRRDPGTEGWQRTVKGARHALASRDALAGQLPTQQSTPQNPETRVSFPTVHDRHSHSASRTLTSPRKHRDDLGCTTPLDDASPEAALNETRGDERQPHGE